MKSRLLVYVIVLAALVPCMLLLGVRPASAAGLTCVWTGGNGLWSTGTNWDCGVAPGAGDTAVIFNGYNIEVGADVSVENLTLYYSTLSGSGNLTVTGLMTWTGASVYGVGAPRLYFAPGALVTITGGLLDTRILANAGTIVWNGTSFYLGTDGAIANLPTATLNFAAAANQTVSNGINPPGVITNSGQLNKTGAAQTQLQVPFNNLGDVHVTEGVLFTTRGGTHGGPFTLAGGTRLELGGSSTNLFNTGADLMGAGTVVFRADGGGSSAVISSTYSLSATMIGGGYDPSVTFYPAATLLALGDVVTFTNGALALDSGETAVIGRLFMGPGWGSTALSGSDVISIGSRLELYGWIYGTPALPALHIAPGAVVSQTYGGISGRTVDNAGTYIWPAGTINLLGHTVFNNRAGALFSIETTAGQSFNVPSDEVFNNAGVLVKSGGDGYTPFYPRLNNSGAVTVATGTLDLAGGGAHTGPFNVALGARLEIGAGPTTFNPGADVSGAGLVWFTGGSSLLRSVYNVTGGTQASGGPVEFASGASVVNVGAVLTHTGYPLNFNTGAPITLQRLALLSGYLGGTDAMTVTGSMEWGGDLTGTLGAQQFTIVPGVVVTWAGGWLDGRTLFNYGTINWTSSTPGLAHSAVFSNTASGVVNIALVGGNLNDTGHTGLFFNGGAMVKTGAGKTYWSPTLRNDGTFSIMTGTVQLTYDGIHGGPFTVEPGATLELQAGTQQFNAGADLSGGGALRNIGAQTLISSTHGVSATTVSGGSLLFSLPATVLNPSSVMTASAGTMLFNNNAAVGTIRMQFVGTLGGSGAISVVQGLDWSGGTITGTAPATPINLLAGSVLTLSGSANLISRTVNNAGNALWSGGDFSLNSGSVFHNLPGGTLLAAASAAWTGDGTGVFVNEGTFGLAPGVSPTWNVPIVNSGAAGLTATTALTMNAPYTQAAGATTFGGGALIMAAYPLALSGGRIGGAGVITGDVANVSGVLSPGASPGTLHITGNYTQAPAGSLTIELGGLISDTQYDLLNVSGTAALDGILNVVLVNGFAPAVGQSFRVLNFASRSGAFANEVGQYPGNNVNLSLVYAVDNLTIAAVATVADLGAGIALGGSPVVQAGQPLTYTLVVSNAGPDPVVGATVTSTSPSGLTGTAWTCAATNGSCGTVSGAGAISATIDLTGTGAVTFTLTAVASGASNRATLDAGVLGFGDPQPGNNGAQKLVIVLNRSLYLPVIRR